MAHLGNDWRWHKNPAAGKMQTGEQIRACAVVFLVAIGGRHERTGIADDHSGASEPVGQQVLVVAPEVAATAGE